jgi:hypothetical protein
MPTDPSAPMTESICTQCGERFHDGACCCDPSAPPLPTLEQRKARVIDAVYTIIQGHGWESFYSELDDLIAHLRSGALRVRKEEGHVLLRESAQQKHDGAALLPADPSAAVTTETLPNNEIDALLRGVIAAKECFNALQDRAGAQLADMEIAIRRHQHALTRSEIGSGNQATPEHSASTHRSAAPKASSSRGKRYQAR